MKAADIHDGVEYALSDYTNRTAPATEPPAAPVIPCKEGQVPSSSHYTINHHGEEKLTDSDRLSSLTCAELSATEEGNEGQGSASPKPELFYGRTSSPMLFIAHRGNINGPNPSQENKPSYLLHALHLGFDVEIDAWLDPKTGQWSLGHDEPTYPIKYDFLVTPGFWVHAKNGPALRAMVQDPRIHCFTHDEDEYTLTSKGYIWAYPEMELLGPKCIAVMYKNPSEIVLDATTNKKNKMGGLCHDCVGPLRNEYIATRKLDETVCSTSRTIQLVIFDLDWVIRKSRRAQTKSGHQVISTECLVDLKAGQDKDAIFKAITAVKQMGISICVTFNCTRANVESILNKIGVQSIVDSYFGNEDVAAAKPSHTCACDAFDIHPSNTLVVAGTTKGFEVASRAGCHLMRVLTCENAINSALIRRILKLEADTEDVAIVVPLNASHFIPGDMPFLEVFGGRTVLEHVMRKFRSRRFNVRFIFVVNEVVAKTVGIEALCAISVDYAQFKIVTVKNTTANSTHAILDVPEKYMQDNMPVLVADGLNIPVWQDAHTLDDMLATHSDAALTVVQSVDPRLSYVRLKKVDYGPKRVVQVTSGEKPFSNMACSGLYYFKEARYLREAASIINEKDSPCCSVFNQMAKDGRVSEVIHLNNSWPLTSADQIESYKRFALCSN